jgi:PIN domain nuclease of toxin-antitoxin system
MQNNILDTHTLLWYINGDERISAASKTLIEEKGVVNFVSIVSLWEISIKISLGKLELLSSFSNLLQLLDENGFVILPISFEDILLLTNLPFHHRDPFDRMLVVQSINNNLKILSKDEILDSYQVTRNW